MIKNFDWLGVDNPLLFSISRDLMCNPMHTNYPILTNMALMWLFTSAFSFYFHGMIDLNRTKACNLGIASIKRSTCTKLNGLKKREVHALISELRFIPCQNMIIDLFSCLSLLKV